MASNEWKTTAEMLAGLPDLEPKVTGLIAALDDVLELVDRVCPDAFLPLRRVAALRRARAEVCSELEERRLMRESLARMKPQPQGVQKLGEQAYEIDGQRRVVEVFGIAPGRKVV